MKILYKNERLKKLFNSEIQNGIPNKKMIKEYGTELAKSLAKRILQLQAAVTLEVYFKMGLGKPHFLEDPYKYNFSVAISKNYRIIVKPIYPDDYDFSKPDLSKIKEVTIMEVVDYHGK
ncbi:hypothetical protein [Metabacillus fastidiosus]|uniref:hypothetical protein n=1 Tax=Metabacillus fastidiosus TaxID=1458 RepID=UPI002DBC7985|nr:hypothetical protein [Metabacillus fastidiosus]MEC2077983.1 hypothetical protein [Metabacillus fastidiosus]